MYKVMIVDDEPFIRKGLVHIVNWKSYDCEVCGEASDGVEGLEKMESLQPDIVFVDINMPEINGLEMIRIAKELLPFSKFVILTGYRDFAYMQEAIKLGAFDYILKPSKIEEISEILKRAVYELKHERQKEVEIQKLKDKFDESVPILKEKFLYDLMHDVQMSAHEVEENLNLYQLHLNRFAIMVVRIDEDNPNISEVYQRQLYQFGMINTIQDFFEESFNVEQVVLNQKNVAFIITSKEDALNAIDSIEQLAGAVQELIQSCFDFTVSMSISNMGHGTKELKDKTRECQEALDYIFYMGPSSIVLYRDIKTFYKSQDLASLDKYEKRLIQGIRTGNEDTVNDILENMKQDVMMHTAHPEKVKHFYWKMIYAINHIRLSIKSAEKQADEKATDMTSLYQMIDNSSNIMEVQELLETVAKAIVNRINQYNKQSINVILQQAMDYIYANYDQSLTLNDLAEETYVSTYYLSRMFTKEIGKNFVDFLNEVRMEKAKELMGDLSLKTYQIAEKVGINDPHYFSKLFKKYVQMTPTEFRNRLK